MATSNIMRIVRGVVGDNALVFNDKLKGGGRSIKVNWGHDAAQTMAVKAALEAEGYTVEMVQTSGSIAMRGWLQRSEALRLHVK